MATNEELAKLKAGTLEEKLETIGKLEGHDDPDDLRVLFDLLSDPKWIVRKAACTRLGQLGPSILEPLEKLLVDGTEDQRFWVMKALVALGREAVPALIRSLTKGPKPTRIYAASALGEIGDPVAIPYLVEALGDEVWRVRRNAFEALASMGEVALEALTEAIESPNEDVVYWAAKAMGKLGERTRKPLLDALKRGTTTLKFILAAALGETGDTRIIQVLINNLKDGSWIAQKRSADALTEIGLAAIEPMANALVTSRPPQDRWLLHALSRLGKPGIEALERVIVREGDAFRWDKKDALGEIGEVLFPLLERLYQNSDAQIRFFAVTCMGDLTLSRPSDDLLLRALSDESWSIRKVSADALAERGPVILERLALAMETGNEDLRYWVTYIFRKMGDLGIHHLVKALGDENKNIAYFAAAALGDVNSRDVVAPLIRALKDPVWPVRKNASDSLVKLAHFSIPELINYVNDEDEDIQYWVIKTLKAIGTPALPDIIHLLKKGNEEQRFFAAKALGFIKDPLSVEPLIESLTDGHEWVRLYAASALGQLGDPRAIRHLIACLSDPSFRVHTAIHKVFENFGKAALPELVEAMRSSDHTTARNAIRVLGKLREPAVFDEIQGYLGHVSDEVKLAAIDAIACYTDRPQVVPILASNLSSGSDKVRSRVFVALGEIGTDDAVSMLVKALLLVESEREKRQVTELISKLAEKAAVVLVRELGNDRVPIRKVAAELLSRLGEKAKPFVDQATQSDDKNVRFWAAKVSKAIRDGQVLE